jgi:hypothetical protein
MPRIVRTARGELIDFDALVIKQQLASAPMNVEVANRKSFIDTQEAKKRGQRTPSQPAAVPLIEPTVESSESEDVIKPVPRPKK